MKPSFDSFDYCKHLATLMWFLMSFFDIVIDCFKWNCNELWNQSTVTRLCYYQIWPLVMAFCIESLQLCVLFKTNFKKYSKLNLTVLNWRWTLFNKFFMDNTDKNIEWHLWDYFEFQNVSKQNAIFHEKIIMLKWNWFALSFVNFIYSKTS